MLYLDYAREPGEWIPNQYGGRENLEAVEFIRRFNELAHQEPGAMTIAEESTAWPGVSRPVYLDGLGFTMKWNMGWMHDMLDYFSMDPVFRKFHQQNITFSMLYAFTRKFRAAGFARRSGASASDPCCRKCRATSGSASPMRARFWLTCSGIPGKN